MAHGYVCFEIIAETADQLKVLRSYFKLHGIDIKTAVQTDDLFDNLLYIVENMDKWFQNVNDHDFEIVGNAILHSISKLFSSSSEDYDIRILQKFVDKVLNQPYTKYTINSRLYLFRNWWYANRVRPYSSIFFYFYLIILEQAGYNTAFLPTISEATSQLSINPPANLKMQYLQSVIKLLTHFTNSSKLSYNLATLCFSVINSCADAVDHNVEDVYFVPLARLLLSHRLLAFSTAESFNPAAERRVSLLFELAVCIRANIDLNQLVDQLPTCITEAGITTEYLESQRAFLQLCRIANQTFTMDYDILLDEMGLSLSDEELEGLLLDAHELGVIKCTVDPITRTVCFRWARPFVESTCSSVKKDIKSLTEVLDQLTVSS